MSKTEWNPGRYKQVASFVPDLGRPLIGLLSPQAHDSILDIGCGDGELSQHLAKTCKELVCVDSSKEMVEAAKQKGLDAHHIDAHELGFIQRFDKAFSNAALHWMKQPEKVLQKVHSSLKDGGIFVAEFGAHGNADTIVSNIESYLQTHKIEYEHPWFFPKADEYVSLVESQGFSVHHIEVFDRFTPLDVHIHDWIQTFAQSFIHKMSETHLVNMLDKITHNLAKKLLVDGVWHIDYVRIRIKVQKR